MNGIHKNHIVTDPWTTCGLKSSENRFWEAGFESIAFGCIVQQLEVRLLFRARSYAEFCLRHVAGVRHERRAAGLGMGLRSTRS
jgi:hypothetical protein